jgi:hypothetical protein
MENKSFVSFFPFILVLNAHRCEACRTKSFVSNQHGDGVIKVYTVIIKLGWCIFLGLALVRQGKPDLFLVNSVESTSHSIKRKNKLFRKVQVMFVFTDRRCL